MDNSASPSTRYIIKWPTAHDLRKKNLVAACELTGVAPRNNWLWPSGDQILHSIAPMADALGIGILRGKRNPDAVGTDPNNPVVTWAAKKPGVMPIEITWNPQAGRLSVPSLSREYASFIEILPDAVREAHEQATIAGSDARLQISCALMAHRPIAPLCRFPQAGKGMWILAKDREDCTLVCRFLRAAGWPVQKRRIVESKPAGFLAAIEMSEENSRRVLRNRFAMIRISQESHSKLSNVIGGR